MLTTPSLGDSILYLIETSQVVVLIGHTGSGKSTRKIFFNWFACYVVADFLELTQYLYEAGWTNKEKSIACTQVRFLSSSTPLLLISIANINIFSHED